MRRTIHIIIPGKPVAKERPRSSYANGVVRHYTPYKTKKYEMDGKTIARKTMGTRPLIEGAVEVIVKSYLPIPKSWSKKNKIKALTGQLHHIVKPDADNFLKTAKDILNKTIIKDDSQSWKSISEKHYSDNPRLEITVIALEDEEKT